jgi:ATP-dependent Lhr-like helicase
MPRQPLNGIQAWVQAQGWHPAPFQREVWLALAEGRSGLLHANTGAGKTLAVWGGVLDLPWASMPGHAGKAGLKALWITPMRALAADTLKALLPPMQALQPGWRAGLRTGDTSSSERARQDKACPQVLVTTPESLSLMLSRPDAREVLAGLGAVVVDEWHELLGNKRGVQVQLALARLRQWQPALRVWGLSATLGNPEEALRALMPAGPATAMDTPPEPRLVRGQIDKTLVIDTLLPDSRSRLSWAGHLGTPMVAPLAEALDGAGTALVFTNTRAQAELWYQMLLDARPEWAGLVALHHGSLDAEVRQWVEEGLKAGALKAVVATSSLDLGVDFLPVERVVQIGSAKGVARLLQRAGRSGHAPGRPSRITLVPTHTLELVEAAAARRAALAGRVEGRAAPRQPLDVLVQHLVTVALGGGFQPEALFAEVRQTHSYQHLHREAFDWALDFAARGGDSLQAYPEHHRIAPDAQGLWRVPQDTPTGRLAARRHRMQVGTIVSDAAMQVRFLNGPRLGTVEEGFIARLRKGDCFVFAGRTLAFVRVQDMTAYVRRAEGRKPTVPRWQGGRMPLSSEMADAVLALLDEAAAGTAWHEPEMQAARPMLEAQARLSHLPGSARLLVELHHAREGHHMWLYPFAGRLAHLGLAAVLAWRLARQQPRTFSLAVNDHGVELLSAEPLALTEAELRAALSPEHLLPDLLASLNAGELAQRRFREIARVSGLVFTGFPGAGKSARQVQASSSLYFEVFQKHDPANRLLHQAREEVLAHELDLDRLHACLQRLQGLPIDWVQLPQPSPFSLPLMVERLRERLSTEKLSDRVARALKAMGVTPA